MTTTIKHICTIIGALLILLPSVSYSQDLQKDFQAFVELYPDHYLPFSIAENDLPTLDNSKFKKIPSKYISYLPQHVINENVDVYAYAAIEMEDGKWLLFHLYESAYPFVREVYMTVYTAEGFPEATELFAAYENSLNETITYAIVNQRKVMHRTTKTFKAQKNEVTISSDKFRLNSIGEIVAL